MATKTFDALNATYCEKKCEGDREGQEIILRSHDRLGTALVKGFGFSPIDVHTQCDVLRSSKSDVVWAFVLETLST